MQTHQCASSRPQNIHPGITTQTTVKSTSLDKDDLAKNIQLPKELESVPTVTEFPSERHRWNTNEEIAAILLAFSEHQRWQSEDVKVWPSSGTMVLYSRKKVRYRRDGFCWKKRRDGKTTREDHMKLKVQGVECIYGCYVHSAILQTFHRRCYWLLQNPEIVLVHYLNVPLAEDSKLSVPTLSLCPEKEWTQEELIGQLQPMFASMQQSDPSTVTEQLIEETIRSIVNKLMISQKKSTGRTHHDCTCVNAPNCAHMGRRIISPKLAPDGAPISKTSQWVHKHLVSMLHGGQTITNSQSGHNHTSGVLLDAARQLDGQSGTMSHTPMFVNLSRLSGTNNVIILNSQATVPLMKPLSDDTSRMPPPRPATIVNPALPGAVTVGAHQISDPNLVIQDPKTKTSSAASVSTTQNMKVGIDAGVKHEPSEKASFSSTHSQQGNTWSGGDKEIVVHSMGATMDAAPMDAAPMDAAPMDAAPMDAATCERNTAKTEPKAPSNMRPLKDCSAMSPHIINCPSLTHVNCPPLSHSDIDLSDYTNIASPSGSHFSLDGFDVINFPDFDDHLKWDLESTPGRDSSSHGQQDIATDMDSGASGSRQHGVTHSVQGSSTRRNSHEAEHTITDFSPEWSYPEGGTKVLVTGPWSSSTSTYTVLLDGVPIPATLVQTGVLRCFTPARVAGLVTLEVACDGHVISNLVVFEYRVREMSHSTRGDKHIDWFTVSDAELKVAVMEKLEELKKRLSSDLTSFTSPQAGDLIGGHDAFETHVVEYCTQLSKRSWCHGDELLKTCAGSRHLTLFHLAAALGCAKLIMTLVKWREENSSRVLEHDVNPLALDNNACTPLMWACALGHTEAATVLYRIHQGALHVCNRDGTTSVHLAQQRGHFALVQHLASLQTAQPINMHMSETTPHTPVSVSTNDSLVSVPPTGGILHFVNTPVASSTPRLVNADLSTVQMALHTTTRTEPLGMAPPVSTARTEPLGMAPPVSTTRTEPLGMTPHASTTHTEPLGMTPPTGTTCIKPLGMAPPASTAHTESLGMTPPTGIVAFPPPPLWHITDSKQLSLEIPAQLTLVNHTGQRGASLPRSLPGAALSSDSTTLQRRFMKRTSIDVLPNYIQLHADRDGTAVTSPAVSAGMRSVNSDPYLARLEAAHNPDPMISVSGRDVNSPDMFMQTDYQTSYDDSFLLDDDLQHESAMDTEDVSNSTNLPKEMVTLANEIIAGMPERNKLSLPPHAPPGGDISGLLTAAEMTVNSCRDRSSSYSSFSSSCSSCHTPPGVSAGVVSTDDSGISTPLEGFACDEYRYPELGTPESSVSPASSCLPSPYSFRLDSPPPTAADFTEYFNAPTTYMQKDFSQLTLSDDEQRKLYVAAQLIQCYYRKYLDKKEHLQEQQQLQQLQQLQQQRELEAAVLIQSYYRRYKQYMYYKKMTQAAVLIQSQFRSYTAQKRFKLSRDAATVIQSRYRAYREHKGYKRRRTAAVIIQQRFRSHYQRKRVKQQESAGKLRKRLQQTEMGAEINEVTAPAAAPPTSEQSSCVNNDITTNQSQGSSCNTR